MHLPVAIAFSSLEIIISCTRTLAEDPCPSVMRRHQKATTGADDGTDAESLPSFIGRQLKRFQKYTVSNMSRACFDRTGHFATTQNDTKCN